VRRRRRPSQHHETTEELERDLAEAFVVSRVAIKYRLDQLGIMADRRQRALGF
jgi:Zn-dependent peptidase ImmA (M78 family)